MVRAPNGTFITVATGNICRSGPPPTGSTGSTPVWSGPPERPGPPATPVAARISGRRISRYRNGQFYLYYSSVHVRVTELGHLPRDQPDRGRRGSRTNQGLIIASSASLNYNAIDPNLVVDDGGQWWLSFGSFWTGIKMIRLDPVPAAVPHRTPRSARSRNAPRPAAPSRPRSSTSEVVLPPRSCSFDRCCRGASSTYRVMVGRSTSVTGPYTDRNEEPRSPPAAGPRCWPVTGRSTAGTPGRHPRQRAGRALLPLLRQQRRLLPGHQPAGLGHRRLAVRLPTLVIRPGTGSSRTTIRTARDGGAPAYPRGGRASGRVRCGCGTSSLRGRCCPDGIRPSVTETNSRWAVSLLVRPSATATATVPRRRSWVVGCGQVGGAWSLTRRRSATARASRPARRWSRSRNTRPPGREPTAAARRPARGVGGAEQPGHPGPGRRSAGWTRSARVASKSAITRTSSGARIQARQASIARPPGHPVGAGGTASSRLAAASGAPRRAWWVASSQRYSVEQLGIAAHRAALPSVRAARPRPRCRRQGELQRAEPSTMRPGDPGRTRHGQPGRGPGPDARPRRSGHPAGPRT